MAAPPEVTTANLTGTYVMNKKLGEDPDEILRLQGLGWAKRKLIGSINVTLHIKQFKDDEGVEHVEIEQVGSGGYQGNTEKRILNWEPRENDTAFGPVVAKARRVPVQDIEYGWQKETWLPDTIEHGAIETRVESNSKDGKKWVASQIWGFSEVKGERRYTRRLHFTGPGGEDIKRVLVYDYQGPNTRP